MMVAIHTPCQPCGKKPPGNSVRLWKPVAGAPMPKMAARPSTMNSTMAVTLMSANQYSKVPKLPTARVFTIRRIDAKASDHNHTGASGNHQVMYTPAATASAPTATTCADQ